MFDHRFSGVVVGVGRDQGKQQLRKLLLKREKKKKKEEDKAGRKYNKGGSEFLLEKSCLAMHAQAFPVSSD